MIIGQTVVLNCGIRGRVVLLHQLWFEVKFESGPVAQIRYEQGTNKVLKMLTIDALNIRTFLGPILPEKNG